MIAKKNNFDSKHHDPHSTVVDVEKTTLISVVARQLDPTQDLERGGYVSMLPLCAGDRG